MSVCPFFDVDLHSSVILPLRHRRVLAVGGLCLMRPAIIFFFGRHGKPWDQGYPPTIIAECRLMPYHRNILASVFVRIWDAPPVSHFGNSGLLSSTRPCTLESRILRLVHKFEFILTESSRIGCILKFYKPNSKLRPPQYPLRTPCAQSSHHLC
jgi:hypothetical protein